MKWMIRIGLFLLAIVAATTLSHRTLAQSSPPTFATFADWCIQQEQLTPGARHTVDVLLEKAGTKDCDRANKILTNLTELDLKGNQISDLSPLPLAPSIIPITRLSVRVASYNQISDLSPLAPLNNLTKLDLSGNQISDLSPLARLTNLTELNLSSNHQISDLSPLARLTNLTVLNLRGNRITDLSPLAPLTNLTGINLSDNEISDLSPLARLTNLRELVLEGNPLSNPTCPQPQTICWF